MLRENKNTVGYITGMMQTVVGEIPCITSTWSFSDKLNTVKMRCGIGRSHYRILPGVYAMGNPSDTSDVFVSANYKLSFDHLRCSLQGMNCWILVLDTKGINVWCAAGKGTFGTSELVNRIRITHLAELVSHRRLILPQLAAPGVAAHEVLKQTENKAISIGPVINPVNMAPAIKNVRLSCGFMVIYGPVRAQDIPEFIANGYNSTPAMRRVTFNMGERALLIPVDFWYGKYLPLTAISVFFLLSGLQGKNFSFDNMVGHLFSVSLNILLAYTAGIILMPLFLPWLPGRSFAMKGAITGFILFLLSWFLGFTGESNAESLSWFFVMTAISSYMAMNFTGSSTYTSLSGVKKEMKIAVPLQAGFALAGTILFLGRRIIL